MGKSLGKESVLHGMHQFRMQAGCAELPWCGVGPAEIWIRIQGTGKTQDFQLFKISREELEGLKANPLSSVMGIPVAFAHFPEFDVVKLFPTPSSDFNAGWKKNGFQDGMRQ